MESSTKLEVYEIVAATSRICNCRLRVFVFFTLRNTCPVVIHG